MSTQAPDNYCLYRQPTLLFLIIVYLKLSPTPCSFSRMRLSPTYSHASISIATTIATLRVTDASERMPHKGSHAAQNQRSGHAS
jgi:hypothetical protein